MRFLFFCGSLRTGSFNKKLLLVAQTILAQEPDCAAELVDLRELNIPVYDGDIEEKGIPEGVKKLGQLIQACDGLVIASPEYNWSIAGSLKNTIDWLSRLRPVPLEGKPVLLMGTSSGAFGAVRGLAHTRAPFETLGSYLYPQPFSLPKNEEAFTASGELTDPSTEKRLWSLIKKYIQFAKKFNS